jgi:hypothetical protein
VGASRLNSKAEVKAIVCKKRGDTYTLVNLIIYSKLSKQQVVNLVILYKANKSIEVLIYSSVNNFGLAVRF